MRHIEKYYNWLFLGLIILTIFMLLVAYFLGKSEDKQFVEDQMNFQHALISIEQDNNVELAYDLLSELEKNYTDNFLVNWQLGWTLGQMGDYEKGIRYFVKSQDQNPVLSRNPIFLLQFSWVMLQAEKYVEAKIYLEHSREQEGITEEQLEIVGEWLQLIEVEIAKVQEGS